MNPRTLAARRLAALCVPTAIALAACGGSDDAKLSPPLPLTLSGTAAVGAAIAGGAVDAKCAAGSGTATTQTDGSYRVEIADGALPCSLRVTSTDGATVLHSAATGSERSVRANLTPATELAMAQLYGRRPAEVHGGFDATTAAALTPAALQSAVEAVGTLLAAAGIPLSEDPVRGALAIGDVNDQALDRLMANLKGGGNTLAEVTDGIVADKGGTPGGAVRPLPLAQLLAASASNCKSLRSGKYRIVFAGPTEGTGVVTLDATTLKVTDPDGIVSTLVANGECRYTVPDDGSELAITSAGIGVVRSQEGPVGSYALGILFPEQVHPVSATEGTWNLIGLGDIDSDNGQGTPRVFAGTISFDATGRSVGTTVVCDNLRDCVDEAPLPEEFHTVNADGGFNFDGGRNFVYKLTSGQKLLVAWAADGALVLATPKVPRPAPVIGTVGRSVNFSLTPAFTANAPLTTSQNTTRSFDAATGIFTRDSIINFTTGVTQPERIELNKFLEGFIHRIPEAVTDSAGVMRNVGEWVALPLPDMGFTPVAISSNNNLVLSVAQPAP